MNKVAAFALRRKNSILSMSEKRFCPPQPLRFWITPAYAGKSCAEQARRFHLRDHPPRMRGKGASGIVCDFVHGITPTCAGKSPAIMVCSLEYWGSPPRVRGKAYSKVKPDEYMGITPAYAGKSAGLSTFWSRNQDHPRVCGEKPQKGLQRPITLGSPPRMRGKENGAVYYNVDWRITPACAGKRPPAFQHLELDWDHPRVCGEKSIGVQNFRKFQGSPPRVRGKEIEANRDAIAHRITPACAGKSAAAVSFCAFCWDHPRVCGEKKLIVFGQTRFSGSPPRVRGKEPMITLKDVRGRITPACAGKRQSTHECCKQAQDHPRVCGEKRMGKALIFNVLGSPPRVRGKGQHRSIQ